MTGHQPATQSPSAWRHRAPVLALSVLGLVIASYLTAFQLGWVTNVWEPFFGNGSEAVLTSQLSHALPVPDASLGVVAYALDIILELVGGEDRWRTNPQLVVGFGVLLVIFALASVGLILVQVLLVRALCTLCLCSAAISISLPLIARHEILAAWHELRSSRASGQPYA